MKLKQVSLLLIALTLTGCPGTPRKPAEERGNIDQRCNPDGSCNGPLLECRASKEWLDVPINSFSTCEIKETR